MFLAKKNPLSDLPNREQLSQNVELTSMHLGCRHVDDGLGQSMVKVLTKLFVRNHYFQVAVRRRDDADVQPAVPPDVNPFIPQSSEQLALRPQRQVGNSIQEQRAIIRLIQTPTAPYSTLEQFACRVSEKFTIQPAFRISRAVHGHERPLGAAAVLVNEACD